MTPIKYSKKGEEVIFHYKLSDLREFVKRGMKHGDVGWILVKRVGNFITYKGYGTIEHPSTRLHSISLKHCNPMDGPMPTDDERLMPEPQFFAKMSTKFLLLKLSNNLTNDYLNHKP